MRKLTIAAFAALLLASFITTARTEGKARPMIVRVHVDSDNDAAYLMSYFDETHNHGHDEIELLLWPGDRAALDALGFDYEVVIEDLFAYDLAQSKGPNPFVRLPGPDYDDYRRLPDYNNEIQQLAKKNPQTVKLIEMKAPSLEGRPVFGLEIAADVKKEDGRPIFYVDGVHHAREWPASEYTMIYAHHLVEKFGKDAQITKLLKKARVILVPIVNVDGFDYSRESVFSAHQTIRNGTSLMGAGNGFEGYWRKNRRSFTGVTVPVVQRNPDSFGVDPNRNYAYLWGDQQGGSSGLQFDQTYRGEAPFSEPETQNVRDIVLGRNVTGVITNHTYQGSVLRAGGGDAPEDKLLTRIGERLAKILGYQNRPSVGYPTTGTTDDWAYAAIGSLGFTIEHGTTGFHPPYAEQVGDFHPKVMDAFTTMAEVAADAHYHSVLTGRVVDGSRPAKATLTLSKEFKTPLSEGNPIGEKFVVEKVNMTLDTKPNGSFEWHVGPSTRPYVKGTEAYTLTIKAGNSKKSLQVRVKRGQRLNLGTIKL
jgi:hypothetical protein